MSLRHPVACGSGIMKEVSSQTLPFFCFNVSIRKGSPARHALQTPTKQRFTMSLVEVPAAGIFYDDDCF